MVLRSTMSQTPWSRYCFDVGRNNVVVFRFGAEDLSLVRFAVSPGHELASAVRVLQSPNQFPLQWGWLRAVRGGLPADAFALLDTVIGTHGYFPDFLTPPPAADKTVEQELAELRRTPVAQVRADLSKVQVRASGARRRAVTEMIAHPRAAMNRIADAWESVWDATLAPHWAHVNAILLADIGHRARTMATAGLGATFSGLHERVSWTGTEVRVRMLEWSEVVPCEGSGLTLVPSVMGSPYCSVVTERPARPTLYYPVHGLTADWAADIDDAERALATLLGEGRARVLRCLGGPRSTSETSETCQIAISTASHHLSVLRAAGLISSVRDRTTMLHERTMLGDLLVVRST